MNKLEALYKLYNMGTKRPKLYQSIAKDDRWTIFVQVTPEWEIALYNEAYNDSDDFVSEDGGDEMSFSQELISNILENARLVLQFIKQEYRRDNEDTYKMFLEEEHNPLMQKLSQTEETDPIVLNLIERLYEPFETIGKIEDEIRNAANEEDERKALHKLRTFIEKNKEYYDELYDDYILAIKSSKFYYFREPLYDIVEHDEVMNWLLNPLKR